MRKWTSFNQESVGMRRQWWPAPPCESHTCTCFAVSAVTRVACTCEAANSIGARSFRMTVVSVISTLIDIWGSYSMHLPFLRNLSIKPHVIGCSRKYPQHSKTIKGGKKSMLGMWLASPPAHPTIQKCCSCTSWHVFSSHSTMLGHQVQHVFITFII